MGDMEMTDTEIRLYNTIFTIALGMERKRGAKYTYAIGNTANDVFYVHGVDENENGYFARIRRKDDGNYETSSSGGLSPEACSKIVQGFNTIMGDAVEIALDQGKLAYPDFFVDINLGIFRLDDQLIEDLDSVLENAGFERPFDELYEERLQA